MSKPSGVRAHARSRVSAIVVAGLAGLAVSSAVAAETVQASDVDDSDKPAAAAAPSETIQVTGHRKGPESPKYTAPLLDTPQTITIIDAGTIRAQNLLTLREILSTTPGITFGAGEGGGGYGDSINLRGYAASSDITVDGVRDSAQYTRTDPFNLEQLELVNGANSVYAGSGSLGGSINIVSKTPHGANRTIVNGALGTDSYYRGTVDADYAIGDGIALRLNVMGHENDVPGRDVEKYSRWGFAPSIAFGLGTDTQLTLSFVHQEDDNIPQYGVPYFKNVRNDGPLPGVDPSNYYGYSNVDTQQTTLDQITLKIDHEFNDTLRVRNLTRWQRVTQLSIVNPPQGTWCLDSGINVSTGALCSPAGSYQPSGPRGTHRDTENTLLYNQTDFAAQFLAGGIKHTAVLGFSFSSEDYYRISGSSLRNPGGVTPNPTLPLMDLSDPDHVYTGPINFIPNQIGDGHQKSIALYLFDTMEFNEQWEFNAGIRYENVEGDFRSDAIATPAAGGVVTPGRTFPNESDLLSYRFGLVFKPTSDASIYIAYGNTQTPSQASVNGGCSDATCFVDPEKGEIFEIGAKWSLMDDRLMLSAALFQNDRTNYKVPANEPGVTDQQIDGAARVRGFSLSATGNITDELTIFANYTWLDTEVLQTLSDYCLANPTQPSCVAAVAADYSGNPLTNTPEHSGSFWLTYKLPHGFTVGYGASYQGEFYLNNTTAPLYKSDSYWVHNAMIAYQATDDLQLQLNVKNLFDEEYYIRIRNNGWATPGEALSATLSANYTF